MVSPILDETSLPPGALEPPSDRFFVDPEGSDRARVGDPHVPLGLPSSLNIFTSRSSMRYMGHRENWRYRIELVGFPHRRRARDISRAEALRGVQPAKDAVGVVTSYISALDRMDYETAMTFLHQQVRIKGPAGETFGKPLDFVEMLRRYRGRYDVKKVFSEGDDVCVFYDLKTTGPTVFMSSWYQVRDGKIASIQTVFDPRAFGLPAVERPSE